MLDRYAKPAVALCLILMLAACAAQGRPRVISNAGDPLVERAPLSSGVYSQFKLAAEAAYPAKIDNPPSAAIQKRFMETGFDLINVQCAAYISGKSDRQRTLNVWRDTFAPITALATGVVALTSKGNSTDSDGLVALALFTSAANSGFEIYEQRYLFGAKNVDNVRGLVLRAQLEHAKKATEIAGNNIGYTTAVRYLMENQMICSPGAILELVSKAIDSGEIIAVPTAAAKPEKGAGGADSGTESAEPTDGNPQVSNNPAASGEKSLFNSIRIKVGK